MSLPLKNRRCPRLVLFTAFGGILAILAVFFARGSVWISYDYRILDQFYRAAVNLGKGPAVSDFPQIKYVTITDETYTAMGTNYLDRSVLARVNQTLADLGVQSVAYDMIFAQPTGKTQDLDFAASLDAGVPIFLPVGLRLVPDPVPFEWKPGQSMLETRYAAPLNQRGEGRPFYGAWALSQYGEFAARTRFSGHISSMPDADGVTRRLPLVVGLDDRFVPALSLSVFLEAAGVSFEDLTVEWGKQVTIPAVAGSFLEHPVAVPIDDRGRAFIPFVQTWEKGFEEMPAHRLLEMAQDDTLAGNLADIFEGNIVFVGDISTGISDLGRIPIQDNVPLVMVHTAMVNGLFTRSFYKNIPAWSVVLAIVFMGIFTAALAVAKPSWPLYAAGPCLILGIFWVAWAAMLRHFLVPAVTLAVAEGLMAGLLILVTEAALSREQKQIRAMFTRYVPQKVVTHLLDNPEWVKMGGENREITILMSDLRGFTALSAERKPEAVIHILNRYLEEMVDIIMDFGGVIDEIIGDGILAFFGAPEPVANHPAQAVACALAMQQAMAGINEKNEGAGLPRLEMGIGINTGEVIVGNIGSERRTKYGAVGSQVNFTGRVESYTIGGQVLITRATRDRTRPMVRVAETMDAKMKGMTEKVRLYSVTGMGEPFNIFLDIEADDPVAIDPAIPVMVRRLAGKVVSGDEIPASITHLSRTLARMISPEEFLALDNLIFHITDPGPAAGPGVYAKVMSAEPLKGSHCLSLRFTSVPQDAARMFASVLDKTS